MKEGFEKAIMRDMSREMADEEGMFHLLVYEIAAEETKNVIDMTLMGELMSMMDDLTENDLLRVFREEWA